LAEKAIKLEVVTPERLLFQEEVDSLVVPATEGYLGVLPNHAPLITGLDIGVVTYRKEGKDYKVAISGGFLEVNDNRAVILADTAEIGTEIDRVRAEEAVERARERLTNRPEDLDIMRAELALKRALARLKATELD
jgi:F-type H+-transporting ATPase subunit epsilon